MKSNRSILTLGVTAMMSCGHFQTASYAQVVAPQLELAPVVAPTVQRVIRVRNVKSDLMAWWLDPAHNEEPAVLKNSRELLTGYSSALPASKDAAPRTGGFALPTGVQSVGSVVPQNALLVLGTEAGIQELQKFIGFLDKPLRQIEIETQFIQISDHDTKVLGPDFGNQKPGQVSVGFVRGNYQAVLAALTVDNRAKVLRKSRVTVINNLNAQVNTTTSQPAVVGFKDETGNFHELLDATVQKPDSRLLLNTSCRLIVCPTINNDDTVTLLMASKQVLQISNEADGQHFELRDMGAHQTIVNVRDGDTLALKGLNSEFFTGSAGKKGATASNGILLVTARIVRRIGDAEVDPIALKQ